MADNPKGHAPKNPLLSPRFGDIPTFARLPHSKDLAGVDLAIVGVPFDGATTYRPGARFGPRGVRVASCLNRNYNPEQKVYVYEKLSAVDFGDVNCNPLNIQKTFAAIEADYAQLVKAKVIPVAIGGDHSVLLPILRAMKKAHPKFGLIHFDAHTDTADQAWGERYHHGTPIRRAIEEGLMQGKDTFQIGIRGPLTSASQEDWDRSQGIHQLTADQIHAAGCDGALADFIKTADRSIPYYLSFDIDGVDPAFAPGTGTPVVGGLTSAQALAMVRALKQFRFIGFDLVEVAPDYDVGQLTCLLASALVFEFMSLAALNKSN